MYEMANNVDRGGGSGGAGLGDALLGRG